MNKKEVEMVCEIFASKLLEKIPESLKNSKSLNIDSAEYVNCNEAARILGISSVRMRARKDDFPHIKGNGQQGRLLFLKSALLSNYGKTRVLL